MWRYLTSEMETDLENWILIPWYKPCEPVSSKGSLNTVGSRAQWSTFDYVLYLSISVSIDDILAILLSSSLTQLLALSISTNNKTVVSSI